MIDSLLHLDTHLRIFLETYQHWTYLVLAMIIFCETGLIATPFLPGDSLLFAIGTIAASTSLISLKITIPLLFLAALLGDSTNFFLGNKLGIKLFRLPMLKTVLNQKHLTKTHLFYEKHGGKTLIIARFIPVVRTFAPFAAGISRMEYSQFFLFSTCGNLIWMISMTTLGYLIGNLPIIQNNFQLTMLSIIFISMLPMIIGFLKSSTKDA